MPMPIPVARRRVTTFAKNLLGGGAERIAVNLLQGLPREKFTQDLVLVSAWGPYLDQLPDDVVLTDLARGGSVSRAIVPLAQHLRRHQPDVLISHLAWANVAAVVARTLARTKTKVVLVEHNDNSVLERTRTRSYRSKALQKLKGAVYRRADAIVGVSNGVSRYVEAAFGLPPGSVKTIYNPVISEALLARSHEPLTHPWFRPGQPQVLLAAGRLRPQKDFVTLLRAFSRVVSKHPCRLVILGEGEERATLEAEVQNLGLGDRVALPGFVTNPYPYMRAASLFVLSSRWEGLPTVLVEAMACGCPVVATDCPSGPSEILAGGKWGTMVEVGDVGALADAILKTLAQPTPTAVLEARAAAFSYERSIAAYSELLSSL